MNYDLNRPWLSLDPWQKEYIETKPEQDCFLLCTRQGGKTTAMSIKAVELCIHKFKKGEVILISSLTERQAQLMLMKALTYAEEVYPDKLAKGKDKPTMHRVFFKNGAGILCYAAGEEGDSTRGYTIKKLMVDEGSRMKETYYTSATPTLSVTHGSMDIASTPYGTKNKYGEETFFYKCSKDPNFQKFYVGAEDCPRHDKDFLEKEKKRMSRLQYAQEYEAKFLDQVRSLFPGELIDKICILKRRKEFIEERTYYLGSDIAGYGKDENAHEVLDKIDNEHIEQVENEIALKKLTTQTSDKILQMDLIYDFRQIGIDDNGLGFGVFSELMSNDQTKRKTQALNNTSRFLDNDGTQKKKIMKEEMYLNLQILMERGKIKLLNDDEIKASLASVQVDEEGNIFASYGHIVEGLIRAAWLCTKDKHLNLYIYS